MCKLFTWSAYNKCGNSPISWEQRWSKSDRWHINKEWGCHLLHLLPWQHVCNPVMTDDTAGVVCTNRHTHRQDIYTLIWCDNKYRACWHIHHSTSTTILRIYNHVKIQCTMLICSWKRTSCQFKSKTKNQPGKQYCQKAYLTATIVSADTVWSCITASRGHNTALVLFQCCRIEWTKLAQICRSITSTHWASHSKLTTFMREMADYCNDLLNNSCKNFFSAIRYQLLKTSNVFSLYSNVVTCKLHILELYKHAAAACICVFYQLFNDLYIHIIFIRFEINH